MAFDAAADAGDEQVGQPAFLLEDLARAPRRRSRGGNRAPSSDTDASRARSRGCSACVRTFVTQSRIASLIASFSVAWPAVTATHFGAEETHAGDVQRLPLHVDRAHVDDAFQAEARADRRRGHAVLAGAGLGDDALFAHALREQDLAEGVVDLVRAGVEQVLALQVNLRAAELLGQALGEIERGRPPDIVVRADPSSSRWKAGSPARRRDIRRSVPSAAVISVSGTNMPPNGPKWPWASGSEVGAGASVDMPITLRTPHRLCVRRNYPICLRR